MVASSATGLMTLNPHYTASCSLLLQHIDCDRPSLQHYTLSPHSGTRVWMH